MATHMRLSDEKRRALLERWQTATRLMHEYTAAMAAFNQLNAELCAELMVPAGYAIDVLGDGEVKPQGDCAKIPR